MRDQAESGAIANTGPEPPAGRSGADSGRQAASLPAQQLAAILKASTDAIISVDIDGIIRSWNPAATRLFGYREAEAVGSRAEYLIVPEHLKPEVLKARPAMMASKQAIIFETMRSRKDGSLVAVQINILPMLDSHGTVTDVSVIYRDISEHIGTVQSLRDSQERYRTLFTSIDAGFCIIEMIFDQDQVPIDYRFLEVNPGFGNHSGIHGALGKRIRELVPDQEDFWFEIYGNVAKSGEAVRFVKQAKALAGRWLDVYACRIDESPSRKVAILFRDVTQVKLAETALRDSEAKLQLGVSIAGVGLGAIDYLAGSIILDETAAAIFDLPADIPIPRQTVHSRFHPGDVAMIQARIKEAQDPAGTGFMAFDHRIVRPDGGVRWVSARKQIEFALDADHASSPAAGLLALRDITERIDRTEALRENELLIRQVVESSPDCVKVLDAKGRIQSINANGCAMLEIDDRGSIANAEWKSMWPAALRPLAAKTIKSASLGVETRFEAERPTLKGTMKWWDVIVTPITDAHGQVSRILIVSRDITRRKNEETLLAASRERLRLAADAARLTYVERDFATGRLRSAENYAAVMGYDLRGDIEAGAELSANLKTMFDHVVPAHRKSVEDASKDFFNGQTGGALEYRVLGDDGIERWIESRWSMKLDLQGQPESAFGTLLDISRRKRVEGKLRESRARLSHAADAAGLTYAQIDFVRKRLRTADNFAAVMGFAAPHVGKSGNAFGPQLVLDHVVADDRLRVEAALQELLTGKPFGKIEYRVRGDDRAERWIESTWSAKIGSEGKPQRAFVTNLNITERKRAEDHARLMMAEVNHRARNLLGVVQAVARQTARRGDAANFVERLTERIGSLAASHDLLAQNQWQGVEMAELARAQLAHFKDLIGTRVLLDGPPARLTVAAAQGIGMALHELATNAAKYGALSNTEGIVRLSWRMSLGVDPAFGVEWAEESGPPVVAPTRTGFGQVVIGRMAETSVDGTAQTDFRESGLLWRLEAPVAGNLEAGGLAKIAGAHLGL